MTDPLPTFTVGVGRAGIEIMQTLADVAERNGQSKFFDYVAVDTDSDAFSGLPRKAKEVELTAPSAFESEDRRQYLYLTEDMKIGVKGAERQRPVGRYKLDSRGNQDFTAHYDTIYNAAREHLDELKNSFDPGRDSYNLFLIHSMGGGTGSGTFPLLINVLDQIGTSLTQLYDIDVYVAGVGVVPRIDQDPEVVRPKGQSIYYPNTYASFRDLSTMIDARNHPRDIPLYSRMFGRGGRRTDVDSSVESSITGNAIPMDRRPFDNYWIVGVEEELISGGSGHTGIENYRDMVDLRVAEGIHSLAQMEESVENWATDVQGLAPTGCIGQSEIRVPHQEVRGYCELKQERTDKQTRLHEEIPEEIEDLRGEHSYVEGVKADPTTLDPDSEGIDDPDETVRAHLEQRLGVAADLVDGNTADDVHEALSELREQYTPAVVLLAADELDEMLQHPSAVPAVETHWEEVIERQWEARNMNSRSEFGGANVRTHEGKERALERYYDEKITEYRQNAEAADTGFLDRVPPVVSLTESDREQFLRWKEILEEAREELLAVSGRRERVEAMVDALDDERQRARGALDDRLGELETRITDLQGETDRLEREIDQLGREIESTADHLTDPERAGTRLSILPIREEALEDLTLERVESELTSLDAYVGEFVDEDQVWTGLERWMERSYAWDDPVVRRDMDGIRNVATRQELWVLFHEDNESYAQEFLRQQSTQGVTQKLAGQSTLGYTGDPYTIQFVTFYNTGPVEGFVQFQRLEQMRESDMLDSMAGMFGNHRLSFAYPEWYDREVAKAFEIKTEVELPSPPELDIDRVSPPDGEDTEGEKRNYVKTNGLDAYVWHGTMWERFDYDEGLEVFAGLEGRVDGLTFRQLQQATPDGDLKARWIAGQADWEEVVDAYARNIADREGIEIEFQAADD